MVSERIILKAERVSKSFNGFQALKDISFEVAKGEVVAILGPSGAGKTVLLRCLAGLEPISAGKIEFTDENGSAIVINGRDASPAKVYGRVSMVFQDLHLWPHMTIIENIIEAPIKTRGFSIKEATQKAEELCKRLDVADQLEKYPRELSIGQQQRVAIARTLAMEPEVILLDEITSALDPERTLEIAKVIESLSHMGITLILVTHHLWLADKLADKFIFLFSGEIIDQCTKLNDLLCLKDRAQVFIKAGQFMGK